MANPDDLARPVTDQSELAVIHRPSFQLRSLPVRYRWEVTRRHPYYQYFWKPALAHYRHQRTRDELDDLLRKVAVAHLGAIGVGGEPPDPAQSFEELEGDRLNAAWLSGAVHPISLRGIAGLLLACLPQETLARVGAILTEGARDDHEDEPPRRIEALINLQTLDKPGLDLYPDEPIVSINPAASGRQVEEAVASLLKEWKAQRELLERRDRADKYDDYLRVWDQREGWVGGAYDRTRERRLRDVAQELHVSVNTVHNQYRGAFALIVGHPYSPELWLQLFGELKISELLSRELGAVSCRRPLTSKTPRPVPETVICPSVDEGRPEGFVSRASRAPTDQASRVLVSDIRSLLGQGMTDEQIAEELELSEKAIPAIAYMRQRGEEAILI